MKGGGSLEFPSIHAWVQSCQQWCNEAQTSVQLLWNSINTRWNFHHYMSTSCVYRAKVKFPSTHDGNSIITCLCYVFIVQRSRFHQHMMECPSLHAYIMDNLNVQQRHWVTLRHWRASSDKTELQICGVVILDETPTAHLADFVVLLCILIPLDVVLFQSGRFDILAVVSPFYSFTHGRLRLYAPRGTVHWILLFEPYFWGTRYD